MIGADQLEKEVGKMARQRAIHWMAHRRMLACPDVMARFVVFWVRLHIEHRPHLADADKLSINRFQIVLF